MSTRSRSSLSGDLNKFLLSRACLLIVGFLLSCTDSHVTEPETKGLIENPLYDQAFDFREQGQLDSAFAYFNRAKDLYVESGDRFGAGKCLVNMAIIMTGEGDFYGSQEVSLEATDYFDPLDPEHAHYLASNFNNLGIASFQLKAYEDALKFYDSARLYTIDSVEKLITLTNVAKVYEEQGALEKAIGVYTGLLEYDMEDLIYARVLTNTSAAKWLMDSTDTVHPDLLHALAIRRQANDQWGLNSSYYHLARFHTFDRPDSALFYARRMQEVAVDLQSGVDRLLALQLLVQLSEDHASKRYFAQYQELNDSLQQARNTAKNQFAVIRYEVEKNKAANLTLQYEHDQKAYQLDRQRLLSLGLVFVVVLFLAMGYYWQRRRRQRIELETQHRIKTHQLHISRKIHDVVANGIYRVMATIENQSTLDRENILDQLDHMYEKSRDISYEDDPELVENTHPEQITFSRQVANLLGSFSSSETQIIIAGNSETFWDGVNQQKRQAIWPVLQELMVNMKKHSKADRVVVRFENQGEKITIHYQDNGVGLPKSFKYGKGLLSTGNRMANLQGALIFDSNTEQGLKLTVAFPIP